LREGLSEARDSGVLSEDAYAMMEGALDVSEMQVRDVMIPRSQMVVVQQDSDLSTCLPLILESGHSRFPVIGEDKDEVEGILLANGNDDFNLGKVLRPAVIIPESKRLNVLLRDFRASRNHMAIVVDEYGGVAGLVTIEDVLEEIVGEIDDEHDIAEDENIKRIADNRYTVHALTPIEEFNENFESSLSDDECDTVGGLVLAEFGRLPESGERVDILGFEFKVINADSRRVHLLEARALDS
jgi:magnesium and cobalt transporter